MVSSLWRLSSALYAHDRRTLPDTTQTPPGATRSHPQSVKHIENILDHVSASGGTFGPPQTNCAHTHRQNRKQGFFRVGTAYCSQCLLHIQKSQTGVQSADWLTGREETGGGRPHKGSRVTKYLIRTHDEQFIGVALLQQHYGHIKGKPQARWENPPFHNHSQSLFMNSFNYVLAIGSNHTILDKSLWGVNNTLILYKLS